MTTARLATNGDAIRALRLAYGWRGRKFAAAVGISPSYLNNIENKRRHGSPEVLTAIARTLNVPLAAITSDHAIEDVS